MAAKWCSQAWHTPDAVEALFPKCNMAHLDYYQSAMHRKVNTAQVRGSVETCMSLSGMLTHPCSVRGRGTLETCMSLSYWIEHYLTMMSTEFNAMVVAAGSATQNDASSSSNNNNNNNVVDDELEETNSLALVPDNNPIPSPRRPPPGADASVDDVPVHVMRKEEAESKISAWQTAEVAKINNRLKREEAIIKAWESEQVEKATAWLKKVERKLDEQRARATEKMQNDAAKAHRKAAEKKASVEAKRGTKIAEVFELANLMRAVGRAPSSKRSFFLFY